MGPYPDCRYLIGISQNSYRTVAGVEKIVTTGTFKKVIQTL